MGKKTTFSSLFDGLFALPYIQPASAASLDLKPKPEPGPPLEHGWEYLRYLRTPAIHSTKVPSHQRLKLAELDSARYEPLDNDIHPLFRFNNWELLTSEQYVWLLPALRVATMFMQQDSLLKFWIHICCSDIKYDKRKGYHLASSERERSPEAEIWTRTLLTETLPEILKLSFGKLDVLPENVDGYTFGNERRYERYCDGEEFHVPYPWFDVPRILLHRHFLYDIEYLSTHGSEDELKNVYLRIAITLCHELAHVVWKHRNRRDGFLSPQGIWVPDDPLVDIKEYRNEIGMSWELYAFEGSIWTIDYPGYFTTYYRPQIYYMDSWLPDIRIVVPRWWINMWFRKSTWKNFELLYNSRELDLPTEAESGYAFWQNKPKQGSTWTLFACNEPLALNCHMTKGPPFILWSTLRLRLQTAKEKEEEEYRLLLEQIEGSCRSRHLGFFLQTS